MLLKSKSIDDSFAGTDMRQLFLAAQRLVRADRPERRKAYLAPTLLRDAWRGEQDGQHWTVAWGKVPHRVEDVHVAFRQARRVLPVPPIVIANRFWVAETTGCFKHVAAFGTPPESRPITASSTA
ncbi:hypothetical protein [Streptomyces sp. NPDC056061]|uniref:hypothetical protein n=1 Tax=Streptomyces sp. NPDC056061 TaxID=3345700 RepID=UPI0035E003E7